MMKRLCRWKKYLFACLPLMMFGCVQAEVKHTFVCVDNQKSQLVYVDQFAPEKSWKVKIPGTSRDCFLLDDERVLVSHPDGAEIYRLSDGASVRRIQGFDGVVSAFATPAGTIWIGSPSGFFEIDAAGKTIRTIHPEGALNHLRLLRPLENGNIVYCALLSVYEIDLQGKVLWTHSFKGKTTLALEQSDGSFFSTLGKETELYRVSRDGCVQMVAGGTANHPDANLAWFSGFDLLPNGHVVVANWRGHGYSLPSKHLFEFDADNRMVWSWDDPSVKGVTTVQMIR